MSSLHSGVLVTVHLACDRYFSACANLPSPENKSLRFKKLDRRQFVKRSFRQYGPPYSLNLTGKKVNIIVNPIKYYSTSQFFLLFFYLGFLSQTFRIYRTAGEEGVYSFISSLPLPPLNRRLDISRATTAESSLLHKASTRT